MLEPPLAARPAQAALARAVQAARDAYLGLAAAARSHNTGNYDSARVGVYAAETGVGTALENYALLGYARG